MAEQKVSVIAQFKAQQGKVAALKKELYRTDWSVPIRTGLHYLCPAPVCGR